MKNKFLFFESGQVCVMAHTQPLSLSHDSKNMIHPQPLQMKNMVYVFITSHPFSCPTCPATPNQRAGFRKAPRKGKPKRPISLARLT